MNHPFKVAAERKRKLQGTQTLRDLFRWCIVGAQKAGTTALLRQMISHKQIQNVHFDHPMESHFFDRFKGQSSILYLDSFLDTISSFQRKNPGISPVLGEKTPAYVADPEALCWMSTVADPLIIFITRDPAHRYLSQREMQRRQGVCVGDLTETGIESWGEHSMALWRGLYKQQLEILLSLFSRVIVGDCSTVWDGSLCRFIIRELGLPEHNFNPNPHGRTPTIYNVPRWLDEFYHPSITETQEFLRVSHVGGGICVWRRE